MRKKLIAVFLILTVLPTGLLIWLGVMSVKSEGDRDRRAVMELAGERLSLVSEKIANIILGLESSLSGLPDMGIMSADEIRALSRRNGLIRQIFIMDGEGVIRYPAEDTPLSAQERDFLTRTREIGLSPGLFLKEAEGDESAARTGQGQAKGGTVSGRGPGAFLTSGWYTWYYGEGLNFIFWRRDENPGSVDAAGGITGTELNRMAVIAALIRGLPDTTPPGIPDDTETGDGNEAAAERASAENFRVSLTDLQGDVIYQWGAYSPEDTSVPIVTASAPAPFSSWRLNYYTDPKAGKAPGAGIALVLSPIIVVILALIGLSVYLYRESTREVREAMRRVTFVNQVSHELKTPLTNIRMYAEMLENSISEDDEKNRRYAGVVGAESRRLSRLIGNVLTFAKEGKSGITLNPVPAIPDEVVAAVAENFKPSLKEKRVELALDLNAGGPVLLDRDALEQIAGNLISNAEKYAAQGGYLLLTTGFKGDVFFLTAADRGPGIAASQRDRVFRPFYRISSKLTDGVTGTGIGLSIVRALARLHGGDARILPSREGAVFEVTLCARPEEETQS